MHGTGAGVGDGNIQGTVYRVLDGYFTYTLHHRACLHTPGVASGMGVEVLFPSGTRKAGQGLT